MLLAFACQPGRRGLEGISPQKHLHLQQWETGLVGSYLTARATVWVSECLFLPLGEGEQSSQAYFLPPLPRPCWPKPNWTCLPMLSSNLLQVGSYLPPWAMVLGTLYLSFKNYDAIAPINQHFSSYSLFLDILLWMRRKTEMSKISTLWENSNFVNISKYALHVDRLNDLKVFSNLQFYNSMNASKTSETQFSLPSQSLHPIFHLNQI